MSSPGNSLASVDGEIMPSAEATIPATDEGLLRGDGAFEMIRVYEGRPFALEDHLARLERSARNLRLPIDLEAVRADAHRLLAAAGPGPAHESLRIVLTRGGRRLLVGTSYGGGTPARSNVIKASDFLLLHGNGPDDPARIRKMIETSRAAEGYRPMPVVINEDDHFRFNETDNHMMAALSEYSSWGYFDPGKGDYVDGYQCPPVNWGINTARKRQFFAALKDITGA